jgi:hypothetical protein
MFGQHPRVGQFFLKDKFPRESSRESCFVRENHASGVNGSRFGWSIQTSQGCILWVILSGQEAPFPGNSATILIAPAKQTALAADPATLFKNP